MTSLLITLPDTIAKASNEAAQKLGISRTEFIRQAIIHELSNFRAVLEEKQIIKSFNAMKKSKDYLQESENVIDTLSSELPGEEGEWWN
jgi:metal-responsive CopG/Arc/MetJ family transcriptional regulator